MNHDRDLRQRVTEVFDGAAPSRGPDDLLEDVFAVTGASRPRPRWWTRLTEKPMRYDSALVSGSPTVRAAGLLAATVLLVLTLAGVALAGAQLFGSGRTYVVSPDGSADFVTIGEAVAAAVDGDTVVVRPGVYREDLVIVADITVRGEGARDAVVVEPTGNGPRTIVDRGTPAETGLPIGIDLQLSDARLEGLSIRGAMPLVGVRLNGGEPSLADLAVSIPDADDDHVEVAVLLAGGSSASLRGLTLDQRLQVREASSMRLFRSDMAAPVEVLGPGRVTVSGNRFGAGSGLLVTDGAQGQVTGNEFQGSGIVVEGASDLEIQDNSVRDVERAALTVSHEGTMARIHGNDIRSSRAGVAIGPGTVVTLAENTICSNETNVFESSSATTEIHDNEVSDVCPAQRPRRLP